MKKPLALVMLFVILTGAFLFTGNVGAVQKNFTSTISPVTAYSGQIQSYNITITDSASNPTGNKLGSASISIPSGFTNFSSFVLKASGRNWNLQTNVSGQIKLTAASSADCINPGQAISISFLAQAPAVAGNYTWTTVAYTNPGWSGDTFTLSGLQPVVMVKAVVLMTFKYDVSDGVFPLLGPRVTLQQFGNPTTISATSSGVSVWADLGSNWSYDNPISSSTTSERWKAAVTPTGTTNSSTTSIDPLYYHQFLMTFQYNVSDSSTSNPLVTFTVFSKVQMINATKVGVTAWADAKTSFTYANPTADSTGVEQWFSNPTATGTVSASVTVDPLYYHQFNVNASYSTSDGSTPSASIVLSGASLGLVSQTILTTSTKQVWLDSGTSWSVNNPILAFSTTEQWIANKGTSGSVTGVIAITPLYCHQYKVTFKYHTSDSSTSDPLVTFTVNGTGGQTVNATKAGVSVWADATTGFSYANPTAASTSTEQWVSNPTQTGTVSSAVTVDPLYKHQYKVTFVVNPSNRAGTTNPSGTNIWENAGNLGINATSYFGYTFSSWTTTTPLITVDANSTLTSANIQGSGTIVANFQGNSGIVNVPGNTSSTAVYPTPNIGLGFGFVGTGGVATANTNSSVPPPPPGVTFIGPLWNITTTADFSGNVTVGIVVDLGTSGTDPYSLRLWQADFPVGDVNFDGIVNSDDTTIINKFYGTYAGGPNWNPLYDLNNNGVVDSKDVNICTHNYGETATWTMLTPLPPAQIPGTTLWVIYGSTDHFSGFGVH